MYFPRFPFIVKVWKKAESLKKSQIINNPTTTSLSLRVPWVDVIVFYSFFLCSLKENENKKAMS